MGINEAVAAIEKFLLTYDGGSGKPVAVQVRPSGDDIDEIKVWIDLGPAKRGLDPDAYERAAAAAIRDALPQTSPFKLDVRAEADPATAP
ncbi:MAG TPA: hypothetical protein VIV11_30890 [Kofleriaceae bacterium]